MEVIYIAKSCEEEDSDENGRNDQINQDNILGKYLPILIYHLK